MDTESKQPKFRSGKDLEDFLSDVGERVKKTDDKDLQEFFEQAKDTLIERSKELEKLKRWEDPHAIEEVYAAFLKDKKQYLDAHPNYTLSKSQETVMDNIAAQLATKGTLDKTLADIDERMEEIRKAAHQCLKRFNQRRDIMEELLAFRSQTREGDKAPQLILSVGDDKKAWVGDSYSETLKKLVSAKEEELANPELKEDSLKGKEVSAKPATKNSSGPEGKNIPGAKSTPGGRGGRGGKSGPGGRGGKGGAAHT